MNETTQIVTAAATSQSRPVIQRASAESGFVFGRFVFFPLRQALLEGDKEVRLGARAAAILTLLIERAGDVVPKEDIISYAWPSTTVDDGNLRVQIAGLRKLLNDSSERPEFISSVVGLGYRFLGTVTGLEAQATGFPQERATRTNASKWPTPLSKLIGREEAVTNLVKLMGDQRLVTIVGPGGIGKTTVALAAVKALPQDFTDETVFVDLAAISDASLVPFAVAAAFNISAETADPLGSLIAFLKERRMFILLDNCEHIIDAATRLAETLLKGVPGLQILATSHEPLRAEGEWLFRLPPLEIPNREDLSLRQALRYPAVELFIDRAMADYHYLDLGDDDVPFIIEICRKLDGIPLAIEIAAVRVEVFGVGELADRLDDRLDAPNAGRRTAVGRHQTIRKMLDWSHDNLSLAERALLRRLSVFAGPFTIEAATMVSGDETLTVFMLTEAISSLVRKSLLHPNSAARPMTYRLLESTRIYASERLHQANEGNRLRRLHLQFSIDMLERAEADWITTRRAAWIERYVGLLDDVRQALSWAFSPTGDAAAGVRLTALVMPLAMQIGLIDEFRERNEVAMDQARGLTSPELVAEMRLNIFTAFLNTNQSQPLDHSMSGVARAEYLAEQTGEDIYRLQPLFQLAGFKMGMGDYRSALKYAETLGALSDKVGDKMAILGSQRMLAQTSHFNGLHTRTISLAKSVIESPVINIPIAFGSVQVDRRVSMRIVLARSLWLQGMADQAVEIMREAVEIAPEDGPHALCHALSQAACPISLWRGDIDVVDDYVHRLIAESSRFTLKHWNSWGRMYAGLLARTTVTTEGDLQVHTLATIGGQLANIDFTGTDFVEKTGWAAPEILRRRGVSLGLTDAYAAKALFLQSLEIAKRQGALSWELRTVTSLTEMLEKQGDIRQATELLGDVYGRFTEGFDTADLAAARLTLERLKA